MSIFCGYRRVSAKRNPNRIARAASYSINWSKVNEQTNEHKNRIVHKLCDWHQERNERALSTSAVLVQACYCSISGNISLDFCALICPIDNKLLVSYIAGRFLYGTLYTWQKYISRRRKKKPDEFQFAYFTNK